MNLQIREFKANFVFLGKISLIESPLGLNTDGVQSYKKIGAHLAPSSRDFLANSEKVIESGWGFTKHLRQICKIFVTLYLKILRLFRLKVLFEADFIKG
jgi:hypothetical protein